MATNAMGNQGLEDAMRQFYTAGGIQSGIAGAQTAADRARATMGFDLESADINQQLLNRYAGAAATGAGAASRYAGGLKQEDPEQGWEMPFDRRD